MASALLIQTRIRPVPYRGRFHQQRLRFRTTLPPWRRADVSARQLHSVPTAADLLSVGVATVWRMIARGDLAVVKVGRRTLISQRSIDAYIDKRERYSFGGQPAYLRQPGRVGSVRRQSRAA